MNKFIISFYNIMLLLFGVLEIGLLWVMSIFFICYISSDSNEVTFFCKDNWLLNILCIVVFIVVLAILKKKAVMTSFSEKLADDNYFKKIKSVLFKTIIVIGVLWVLITQYVPGSDQLDVMASAYKYGAGQTDMVEAHGYLDKWLHNVGITTVERVFAIIVGDYNAVFMQLLNVLGIALIYKKLVDSWDKLGGSRLSQVCIYACGVIFYPLIMYASFVYGNIWSVTFALIAFDAELDFFEQNRYADIFKCALTLGLSYIVKGSGIIFVVAVVIYAIVRGAIDKAKWYKVAILIVLSCLSIMAFNVFPKMALAKVTNRELRDSDGIWSFIAMGLQENGTAPGWYNGYCLNVYYDNGRNSKVSEAIAKQEVLDRLEYLFSDKHHAFAFFSKKIASMWIEPTYQGYWINQVRTHRTVFPAWLDAFMSVKGYTIAAKIFDVFLVLTFTGNVLWLVLGDKKKFASQSFFLLSVVGGFTFHLSWEIKGQYAITYFVLLFPYAIAGYELLLEKGKTSFKESNKDILAYVLAVAVIYMVAYKADASNCLSQHNVTYASYVKSWQAPYMTESIEDINRMKAQYQEAEKLNVKLLDYVEENK